MKQYLDLVKAIKEKGTFKSAARENMPGTLSLFGYQMRFNLQEGFPAVTTKQLYWKGVVVELLWFLRGDTNIKYLDNLGVRKMWHEDAYNYYCKIASKNNDETWNDIYMPVSNKLNQRNVTFNKVDGYSMFTFEEFCSIIKNFSIENLKNLYSANVYTLGDCGKQYGWLWRNWGIDYKEIGLEIIRQSKLSISVENMDKSKFNLGIDQIKELIKGLKTNPESRSHIISAWNVATLEEMALKACHSFSQFNCRHLTVLQRQSLCKYDWTFETDEEVIQISNYQNIPKYYLDCNLYQRSGDVFLGVPLNIASYALLTHIISKICNMIPGDFIHSFGDVHIYENHIEAVEKQLQNEPKKLPTLKFSDEFELMISNLQKVDNFDDFSNYAVEAFQQYDYTMFTLENYEHCGKIEAELSTGMIK